MSLGPCQVWGMFGDPCLYCTGGGGLATVRSLRMYIRSWCGDNCTTPRRIQHRIIVQTIVAVCVNTLFCRRPNGPVSCIRGPSRSPLRLRRARGPCWSPLCCVTRVPCWSPFSHSKLTLLTFERTWPQCPGLCARLGSSRFAASSTRPIFLRTGGFGDPPGSLVC